VNIMYKYIAILFLLGIIVSQSLLIFINYDYNKYYTFGRYKLHANHTFEDTWRDNGFEQNIYSYSKVGDKLYLYGESGITIITMNVINPKVIKIPNGRYYDFVQTYGKFSIYTNSLEELSNIYGNDFIVLNRLEELDSNDYSIVKELIEQGKDKAKKSSLF
ncbi:MAG: hypothetical protein E6967_07595, partial [Veillonella sp.]|nr:hypothetical protein [Veillonella sp.]